MMFKSLKYRLGKAIFSPQVDDRELNDLLLQIKHHLPIPVFWLLGKAQSGKTSIIRSLTGRSDAEIGNGFQPCTQTARLYDFPDPENCLMHFLDTRGLGEVDYDPGSDMRLFMEKAHVIVVVIKALDHAQQDVLRAVKSIHKQHPEWPVILVQTTLHEGYPTLETPHIEPYPYARSQWPATVPQDLARSLLQQREWFTGMDAHFVAVDFTLDEDGYVPTNYGIDALWSVIEKVLPLGLRGMIQMSEKFHQLQGAYANSAHPHIITYALLAGSAEAIPVPIATLPVVLSIQAKMIHTIASIYNQQMTWRRYTEIAGTLGLGYVLRLGGRELVKLIPGYGSAVAAVYTGGVTYALGKTFCAYFNAMLRGEMIDKTVFEKIYREELLKGRQLLSQYFGQVK